MNKNLILSGLITFISLFFTNALFAQGITEKDKTEQEEVLQEDPRDYAANFVVGAYYYNLAVDPHLETTKMNLVEYLDEGESLEEKKRSFLKKALPYFENAYALKEGDTRVREVLKVVYQHLGMIPMNKVKEEEVEKALLEKLDTIEFKEIQ